MKEYAEPYQGVDQKAATLYISISNRSLLWEANSMWHAYLKTMMINGAKLNWNSTSSINCKKMNTIQVNIMEPKIPKENLSFKKWTSTYSHLSINHRRFLKGALSKNKKMKIKKTRIVNQGRTIMQEHWWVSQRDRRLKKSCRK